MSFHQNPQRHPQAGKKYIFYSSKDSFATGLSDRRSCLAALLAEAEYTKRIPVIPKFNLCASHNNGIELPPSTLLKYLSLEMFRSVLEDYVSIDDFDFDSVTSSSTISGEDNAKFTDLKEHLLIRRWNHANWYVSLSETFARTAEFHGTGMTNSSGWFLPSETVLEIANKVVDELGSNYIGLHLRRGDKLKQIEKLDRETSPSNILRRLQRHRGSFEKIYLCSDEKDVNFFDSVRSKYKTYSWRDFNYLQTHEILNDNYLLFAIEMCILMKANKAFYTFTDSTPWFFLENQKKHYSITNLSTHPAQNNPSVWEKVVNKVIGLTH